MTLFCGIDFGTTNTKAVLLDQELLLLDRTTLPVNDYSASGTKLIWYSHFKEIIQFFKSQGLLNGNNVVCSITSQGGTFVFLDENFMPIIEPVSWLENADQMSVNSIDNILTSGEFYKMTGWEPHPWLAVFKIKEYLTNKKSILKKLKYVSTIPEYIHAQLTGEFTTDITNAQITGMCDFESGQWSSEILDWIGLSKESLPKISTHPEIIIEEADVSGVKIRFATSSHDQYAAIQAAGLISQKDILLGTGTAWVLNGVSDEPVYEANDFSVHPGRDVIKDRYGYILTLGPIGSEYDAVLSRMNIDQNQADGLISNFNQASLNDDNIDLTQDSSADSNITKAKTIKSYMDQAANKVALGLEKLGFKDRVNKIVMSGGAANSSYWPQAIATACGVVVETVKCPEFTAYGAALLARVASGFEESREGWPDCFDVLSFESAQ